MLVEIDRDELNRLLQCEEELNKLKYCSVQVDDTQVRKLNIENNKLKEENNKLKKELDKYRNRGAGRKPRFTNEEIEEMQYLYSTGNVLKSIAEKFNCSLGTVHKLVNKEL